MTRRTESIARAFLLEHFRHPAYEFSMKQAEDAGFDLWLVHKESGERTKAELKAHTGVYSRPSNLIERIIFNADIEKSLFEAGDSVIIRVFLGEVPFRVFVVTNKILGNGAALQPEARYVLRGKINYHESYQELQDIAGPASAASASSTS